jgi:hypothetical protein
MDLTSQLSSTAVATVYDVGVARRLAALLNSALVPAEAVSRSSATVGPLTWEVRVPAVAAEQARLILAPSVLSDAELNYLATHVLPGGDEGK